MITCPVTYYSTSRKSLNKRLASGRVLRLRPPTHWTQFALRSSACVCVSLLAFACACVSLLVFACVCVSLLEFSDVKSLSILRTFVCRRHPHPGSQWQPGQQRSQGFLTQMWNASKANSTITHTWPSEKVSVCWFHNIVQVKGHIAFAQQHQLEHEDVHCTDKQYIMMPIERG